MAIFKRCNSCHQLYEGQRCPTCSAKYAAAHAAKRQRENPARKLYGSGLWRRCRQNVIARDFGFDIWLLGAGQLHKCKHPVVHHIIERDEAPDLIFDIDNLITVTKESHEEIHRLYLTAKDEALERIREGRAELKRRFGDEH
jgi:hypothetical protein